MTTEELAQALLQLEIHLRRHTSQGVVRDLLPDRAAELVLGLRTGKNEVVLLPFLTRRELLRDARGAVVDGAQHGDNRSRQDRRGASLVVERHVAAGHRSAQLSTAIGEAVHGLAELPHHPRILRGTEVQAVGHGHRGGTRHGHIAVRLGQS